MTRRRRCFGDTSSESLSIDILLYYNIMDALGIRYYLYTITPTFAPLPLTAPVEPSDGTLHPNTLDGWPHGHILSETQIAVSQSIRHSNS